MEKDSQLRDHLVCDVALMIGGVVVVALALLARAIAEHEVEEPALDGAPVTLLGLVGVVVFAIGAVALVLDARNRRTDPKDVD